MLKMLDMQEFQKMDELQEMQKMQDVLKIVIVEDEEIIRMGLAETVDWRSMGAQVAGEAADGLEGLDVVAAVRPDVVLTDIKMPRMNGLDMAKALAEQYPEMKIVFLTSYADFEYARQAVRLNACDYLLKPVDEGELAKLIIRLREQKEAAARARLAEKARILAEKAAAENAVEGKIVERTVVEGTAVEGRPSEEKNFLAEKASSGTGGAEVRELANWQSLLAHAELNVYVRQALETIQQDYSTRLSIEDCAEAMQVSTSYLSRKLKEATGQTFGMLLARYRLQEAIKLLEDGRYRVYEVAEHTGFGEYKNFCQVFKKYLHVSPKRYMQERELKATR